MRLEEQEINDLIQTLLGAGFNEGWALQGNDLVLWEHDEEPPAPLTRPAPLEDL
jgi:hypothetical protein